MNAPLARYKKDPDATLDFPIDWGPWLTPLNDTIASVQWITNDGAVFAGSIMVDSQSIDGAKAIAIVSGGVEGTTEKLTCRVTTSSSPPRIDDRTIDIRIVER